MFKRFLFFLLLPLFLLGCAATDSSDNETSANNEHNQNPTNPPASATPPPQPTVIADESEVVDIAGSFAEAGEARPNDWVKGNPDAPVTIVEYGDFQ